MTRRIEYKPLFFVSGGGSDEEVEYSYTSHLQRFLAEESASGWRLIGPPTVMGGGALLFIFWRELVFSWPEARPDSGDIFVSPQ